jgi:cytochrome c oxidase subunit 2
MGNLPIRPDAASNWATEHDSLFGLITLLTIVFTILVIALVIFFAVKYRRGSKVDRGNRVHEHLKLEITWSVIPMLLGLGVFAWGASLYARERVAPKDAMEIFVIGKQWMWHIQHMNGVRENNELTVPIDTPVKLTMVSQDVIHAFYVPEFRIQYMVVPGRYTQQWFIPTKIGRYRIFCNMYCGTDHSEMIGYVNVVTKSDYQRFLGGRGAALHPTELGVAEMGKNLYEQYACANCHGPQDAPRGPALYGITGTQRPLQQGGSVLVDDDYLRESLVDPSRQIVRGYDDIMPSYKDLTEEQLLALVTYIKTLGIRHEGGATPPAGEQSTRQSTNTTRVEPRGTGTNR